MAERKMPRLEGCHEKIIDTKLYAEVSKVNISSINPNPPNPPPNPPSNPPNNDNNNEEKDEKKQEKKEDK